MLELLELFPLRYPLMIPALNCVGWMLKHRTGMRNECIPMVLFAIACASSILVRRLMSPFSGWYFWFDAVFLYGIVNSLKLTLYAIGGYEAVRAMRFSTAGSNKEKAMLKRPFVRLMLASIAATIVASAAFLAFGSAPWDIFLRLSDGWFYGILVVGFFDAFYKIAKKREKLTVSYWVMWGSVMASAIAFCLASTTADRLTCIVALAVAGVFAVSAALCIIIPAVRERNGKEEAPSEFDADAYRMEWTRERMKLAKADAEKKLKILSSFLCFKLVGDSLWNDIDFSRPLFAATTEDGKVDVMSVTTAIAKGADTEDVDKAVEYLQAIIASAGEED